MALRVAAAQLDLVVGDLDGNLERLLGAVGDAKRAGCDVVVLPELAITGYPPEDLLLAQGFVTSQLERLDRLAEAAVGIVVVVGFVDQVDPRTSGDALPRALANAAAVCVDGAVRHVVHKTLLPNYGVFDEERYFAPRQGPLETFDLKGTRVGVAVCEDLWAPSVADGLAEAGAELILVVNASPYHRGKPEERTLLVSGTAQRTGCSVVYANLVGGQDEVVFDGASLVVDSAGSVVTRAPLWEEALLVAELDNGVWRALTAPARWPDSEEAEVYGALVTGLHAYVRKNGFRSVVLGLSGGIDSALVAALAVDALGPEYVHGVGMPGPYSSTGSVEDARDLAERLGVAFQVLPIGDVFAAYKAALNVPFADVSEDVTEENLQARIRGAFLMALSNKFGHLVLSTGNKSEMAVGYSTLYGDLAGGLSPIKDTEKTLVYRLCRWRNENVWRDGPVSPIPLATIEKPPSAELAPDQVDQDSLPPYDLLDEILRRYVEECDSPSTIASALVGAGWGDAADLARTVDRVVSLVDRAEYKRRQAPPGVKVTPRAFGRDRRLPLTNRFRPRALALLGEM